MIIEDKNIYDLYFASVRKAMFDSRFAKNGKDTLEIYHAWHPDILV